MDKLSELQAEAKEDLIIIDDEDLHQQSYKNQIIKPKWLDYKSKYKLMMFQCKGEHKRLYREKWEYYETIVEFIDGVIKSIDNRGWDIRNAQDWKKFLAGGF